MEGLYEPTPQEIATGTAEIRSRWSDAERSDRSGGILLIPVHSRDYHRVEADARWAIGKRLASLRASMKA